MILVTVAQCRAGGEQEETPLALSQVSFSGILYKDFLRGLRDHNLAISQCAAFVFLPLPAFVKAVIVVFMLLIFFKLYYRLPPQ